jgi:protein TonB
MAFEAFLTQDKAKPTARRSLLITASLIAHGALLTGGVIYSFWHVDELSPPTVTVTFLANAPPPPPPPAAKKKTTEKRTVTREVVQPKPNEIIQPKKEEKQEDDDDGVVGGSDNGVKGGVVGGFGDGPAQPAAPPPPPPPEPPAKPTFVGPNIGNQQMLTNPNVPPYKLILPPAFQAAPGTTLWAMLQICVGVNGSVSNVSIIKGMDPKVDGLLAAKVRTWRYRPMSVDGKPVPFCYRLRYNHQVSS